MTDRPPHGDRPGNDRPSRDRPGEHQPRPETHRTGLGEDSPLPCGVRPSALLARLADGEPPTEHSAHCPYCQSTLDTLSAAWRRVRQAAQTPTPPSPSLVGRALARVRAERETDEDGLTVPGDRGTLRVLPRALVRLATTAAAAVPTVVVHSGRVSGSRIVLHIGLQHGSVLATAESAVRQVVAHRLRDALGVAGPPIDLDVVDVW